MSRSGLQAFERVLSTPWVLVALLGLAAFGTTVEAARLRLLFRAAGLKLDWGGAYRVVPVSTFFNFCIPGGTGGDVVKLYYLARANRHRGVEVATVVLVDRVIALSAVLFLVLLLVLPNLGLVQDSAVLRAVVLMAAGGLVAIGIVISLAWSRRLRRTSFYAWVMHRMPFRRHVERVADAVHAFRERRRAIAAAALVSVAGHLGLAATYVAVATVVLPTAPWTQVGFLSLMGMVANAIPLTPGGLGVGEAAFEQLFLLAGFSGGAFLLVFWRLSMVPLAMIGATLYITGRVHADQRLSEPSLVEINESTA